MSRILKLLSALKLFIKEPDWFSVMSDFFINLAAGWFAAVLIVPNYVGFQSPLNFLILTSDVVFGILSLLVAFKLRKLAKKENG